MPNTQDGRPSRVADDDSSSGRPYVAPLIWSDEDLHREIEQVVRSEGPLLVGPWLSEVGYEILYWIPFLRWIKRTYRIPAKRMIALSRGGVADWYANLADGYVELFDYLSPDEFRQASDERSLRQNQSVKQFHYDPFDAAVVARVQERLGLGAASVLHPHLMYRSFNPYWGGEKTRRFLTSHTVFERLPPPSHPILADLPPRFYAVKFYERLSFPRSSANRRAAETLVGRLAQRLPVVVLDRDLKVDDHGAFGLPPMEGVHFVADRFELRDNLRAQSAIMARAEATFGTYGGMIYVPMLYGRPAVGLYSDDFHLLEVHGNTVFRMADAVGSRLAVARTEAFDLIQDPSAVATGDRLAATLPSDGPVRGAYAAPAGRFRILALLPLAASTRTPASDVRFLIAVLRRIAETIPSVAIDVRIPMGGSDRLAAFGLRPIENLRLVEGNVHADVDPDAYDVGVAAASALAAPPGVPIVVVASELLPKGDRVEAMQRAGHALDEDLIVAAAFADRLICSSGLVATALTERLGRHPADVYQVAFGRDVASGAAERPLPAGLRSGGYLLFPAANGAPRNAQRMLRAFQRYRETHPDSDLVLALTTAPSAGAGIRRMVARLSAERRVVDCGDVDEETYAALVRGARALVDPAVTSAGSVALDACLFDRPFLGARGTASAEHAPAVSSLVDPAIVADMVDGLTNLLAGPDPKPRAEPERLDPGPFLAALATPLHGRRGHGDAIVGLGADGRTTSFRVAFANARQARCLQAEVEVPLDFPAAVARLEVAFGDDVVEAVDIERGRTAMVAVPLPGGGGIADIVSRARAADGRPAAGRPVVLVRRLLIAGNSTMLRAEPEIAGAPAAARDAVAGQPAGFRLLLLVSTAVLDPEASGDDARRLAQATRADLRTRGFDVDVEPVLGDDLAAFFALLARRSLPDYAAVLAQAGGHMRDVEIVEWIRYRLPSARLILDRRGSGARPPGRGRPRFKERLAVRRTADVIISDGPADADPIVALLSRTCRAVAAAPLSSVSGDADFARWNREALDEAGLTIGPATAVPR